MGRWNRWQDWATVAFGVALMAMPLVTQTSSTAAICTAYGMGALIVLAGLAAAYAKSPNLFEWVAILLGVVLIAMPWIFAFTNETVMAWAAWIAGVGTIVVAGYEALFAPRRMAAA